MAGLLDISLSKPKNFGYSKGDNWIFLSPSKYIFRISYNKKDLFNRSIQRVSKYAVEIVREMLPPSDREIIRIHKHFNYHAKKWFDKNPAAGWRSYIGYNASGIASRITISNTRNDLIYRYRNDYIKHTKSGNYEEVRNYRYTYEGGKLQLVKDLSSNKSFSKIIHVYNAKAFPYFPRYPKTIKITRELEHIPIIDTVREFLQEALNKYMENLHSDKPTKARYTAPYRSLFLSRFRKGRLRNVPKRMFRRLDNYDD